MVVAILELCFIHKLELEPHFMIQVLVIQTINKPNIGNKLYNSMYNNVLKVPSF